MYWEPQIYSEQYFVPTGLLQKFDRNTIQEGRYPLDPKREEWKLISEYFYLTMPKEKDGKPINTITNIWRFSRKELVDSYVNKLTTARMVHLSEDYPDFQNSIEYEKLLWHGTGTTDPTIIIREGFRILNWAGDKNMWGRGIYFASSAAYCSAYAYQDKTGHKQMFLAKVITGLGLQCLENKNIFHKPEGYNSIVGWRHGSWIYVLYDNNRACPWYLVEWSENK